MNNKFLISLVVFIMTIIGFSANAVNANEKPIQKEVNDSKSSLIQIAILLDTSGSMEGLLDQARIQIWNVVDELAASRRDGGSTELEVAVFRYGSNNISKSVFQVLDFSGDLDEVSRALFSLEAEGGIELCGEVIRRACDDLNWSEDAGYRAIFIAGNEGFDQGPTTFASVFRDYATKALR